MPVTDGLFELPCEKVGIIYSCVGKGISLGLKKKKNKKPNSNEKTTRGDNFRKQGLKEKAWCNGVWDLKLDILFSSFFQGTTPGLA
jgi:hypothetical protein